MPDRIPISLIEEIFKILRDTINKNTDKLDKLIETQSNLLNYLRTSPSASEIKSYLEKFYNESVTKESIKDMHNDVKLLKDQYLEIKNNQLSDVSNEIGKKPNFDDLKIYFEGHEDKYKQAVDNINEINKCLQEKSATFKEENDILKKIHNKLNTMISVVIIAFTLLTLSYYYVKNTVDTTIKKEINTIMGKELNNKFDSIIKKINEIEQLNIEQIEEKEKK